MDLVEKHDPSYKENISLIILHVDGDQHARIPIFLLYGQNNKPQQPFQHPSKQINHPPTHNPQSPLATDHKLNKQAKTPKKKKKKTTKILKFKSSSPQPRPHSTYTRAPKQRRSRPQPAEAKPKITRPTAPAKTVSSPHTPPMCNGGAACWRPGQHEHWVSSYFLIFMGGKEGDVEGTRGGVYILVGGGGDVV